MSDLAEKNLLPVFAVVSISFLLAIGVSFFSQKKMADDRKRDLEQLRQVYEMLSEISAEQADFADGLSKETILSDIQSREDELEDYNRRILLNLGFSLAVIALLFMCFFIILKRAGAEKEEREKLLAKAERAIAASEAKSSFLSSMSHEIRTPINAVLGMNEMILRESGDKTILEYASNIKSAGKTLLSLINSILDFSKIEEGKMEIVPVNYHTTAMINNLVVSISERARKKDLNFIVDVDWQLPTELYGDDVRLSQVMLNILTNAVKYTEAGHVCFTIRGSRQGGEDIDLFVSVEDTGIGIQKEDMGRLFESFARLDEEKNHNVEGTGLGMSIVSRLLHLMGSEIHVNSIYGKGTTFSFTIRQKIVDDTPIGDYTQRLEESKRYAGKEAFYSRDAKVLIVDDNGLNLKVAKNLLKLYEIEPDLVGSGTEAIACLRDARYHIVFLDHMMPKMDGIETLKTARKVNILPAETKVVALTANAVNNAREEYLKVGFDGYLSKPIEVGELGEILKAFLPGDVLKWREDDVADAPEEPEESGSDVLEFEPDAQGVAVSENVSEELGNGVLEFVPDAQGVGGSEWDFRTQEDHVVSFDRDGGLEMDVIDRLEKQGFDVDSALSFCGQDEEFYVEMLGDYVDAYARKNQQLNEYFDAENWKDFEIVVHSVKSTSKTMGAMALADQALALEQAAKSQDAAFIRDAYPKFAEEYSQVVEEIRRVVL